MNFLDYVEIIEEIANKGLSKEEAWKSLDFKEDVDWELMDEALHKVYGRY